MLVIKKVLNAFTSASTLRFEQAQWLSLFENHLQQHHVSMLDLEASGLTRLDLVNHYGLSYDPSIAAHIAAAEVSSVLPGMRSGTSDRLRVEEIVIDTTPLPTCSAA